MKVLLLGSGSVGSSLSARVVSFGRELVKSGHTVTLVVPRSDKYNDFDRTVTKSLHGMRVIHPRQLSTRFESLNLLTYVPSAMWQVAKRRVQIVHIYKPTPLTLVGLVKVLDSRTKIVLDMDDLGHAVMEREGHLRWKVFVVKWSERLAVKSADAIITASSYLRTIYTDRYPAKRVVWIPNGVQRVIDNGDASDNNVIVFIGSLNVGSSAAALVEALPFVARSIGRDELTVTVIGDGSERQRLSARVDAFGLGDRVTFTSRVDYERLGDYVVAGSIGFCCLPDTDASRAASNQKVFDYMSFGVVPFVNDVGDLPYYVEFGRSGFIAHGDLPDALALALADIPGRRERVDACRGYLAQHFTWPTLARQAQDLYAAVAATEGS